jgi:hypothetical protein
MKYFAYLYYVIRVKDMKVLNLIWFGLRVLKMLGY